MSTQCLITTTIFNKDGTETRVHKNEPKDLVWTICRNIDEEDRRTYSLADCTLTTLSTTDVVREFEMDRNVDFSVDTFAIEVHDRHPKVSVLCTMIYKSHKSNGYISDPIVHVKLPDIIPLEEFKFEVGKGCKYVIISNKALIAQAPDTQIYKISKSIKPTERSPSINNE